MKILLKFFKSKIFKQFTEAGIPFFINPLKEMLRLCIGNPKIAASIKRYPVIPHGHVRYVLMLFYIAFYVVSNFIIITSGREMFLARRWHDDSRFFSPMAVTKFGNVFIHDFVRMEFESIGCVASSFAG